HGRYAEACATGALPKVWTPPQPSSTYPPAAPSCTATPRAMSQPGQPTGCASGAAEPQGWTPPKPSSAKPPGPSEPLSPVGATAPPLGSCCHGVLSLGPTSHIWYAYATGQIGGAPKRSDAQRCASSTHSYCRP